MPCVTRGANVGWTASWQNVVKISYKTRSEETVTSIDFERYTSPLISRQARLTLQHAIAARLQTDGRTDTLSLPSLRGW